MVASRQPLLKIKPPVAITAHGASQALTAAAHREGVVLRTFYHTRGKRLLDITLGSLLFVGCLPMMVIAAVAVLCLSGWPILYRAERLGRNGRPLRLLKLRTMVNGAHDMLPDLLVANPALAGEYSKKLKLRRDPRRTKIGATLRRFSIDELPQFWHVVTGDMTLVGPRPYAVEEKDLVAPYPEILSMTPGVTGPWQVRGRSELPPEARIALDVRYATHVTIGRDLRYMLATLDCLMRPNGQ